MDANNNECKRCGVCCMGRGDIAYGCDSVESDQDCPELSFDENGLACCGIHGWKPTVCDEYPFDDMDNGLCERQQKEAGVWVQYIYVDGELARRDQKGKVTMCFKR